MFCRERKVCEKKRVTVGVAAETAGKARQPLYSCVGFWLLQLINRDLMGWHDCSFPLVEKLLYAIISDGEENVNFILQLREIGEQ